ncbi:hypothetical protein AGMMS50229_15710 [Campylobacterota bacterium]|nr:hypothetical protein AGMMS50229_15710 [Campylobacterota bacterium]
MWVLIAGVVLLAIELLTGSLYFLWYGIGMVGSGAIGWAIGSENWAWQALAGLLIGLALMIALRKRLMKPKGDERADEFLLEEGLGVVSENSQVEFRGTFWHFAGAQGESYAVGEEVLVTPAQNNTVKIRKKQ